jgi:hypothetical protein
MSSKNCLFSARSDFWKSHFWDVVGKAIKALAIALLLQIRMGPDRCYAGKALAIASGFVILFHGDGHHPNDLTGLALDQSNGAVHSATGFDPLIDQ